MIIFDRKLYWKAITIDRVRKPLLLSTLATLARGIT